MQTEQKGRMQLILEREKKSYSYAIQLEGESGWQQVVLSTSDFKNRDGESPEDWNNLDIAISIPGGWEWSDLKMHDLKWIRNEQRGDNQ